MKSLKQPLEPNVSFLLACEGSTCGETLEGRNRNGGGINRLISWFANRWEGSIFGDTIRKSCYQSSFHLLKNARKSDLIHWFKKMEPQLTSIIIMDQCTSSTMWNA